MTLKLVDEKYPQWINEIEAADLPFGILRFAESMEVFWGILGSGHPNGTSQWDIHGTSRKIWGIGKMGELMGFDGVLRSCHFMSESSFGCQNPRIRTRDSPIRDVDPVLMVNPLTACDRTTQWLWPQDRGTFKSMLVDDEHTHISICIYNIT